MNAKQQQRLSQALAVQNKKNQQLRQQLKYRKILSTLPYQKSDFWWQSVDSILPSLPRGAGKLAYFFSAIVHISKLLWVVNRYELLLLTGGERRDLFYVAIAGCLPWIHTPHVITDAHWQAKTGLSLWLQKTIFKLGNRLTKQVQPHSDEECYLYSQQFQIPFDKLKAVPWSVSLTGYQLNPVNNSLMILTGGASFRDYGCFYQAVKDLDLPIEIGLPQWFDCRETQQLSQLNHVNVHHHLNRQQYYEKMAKCNVLAMPMPSGLTRCAGDQTLLNAMSMGKIVVVTDSVASRLYIRDGENGFIIPVHDHKKWREVLLKISNMSREDYQKIANQAEFDAKFKFNEEKRLQDTLALALR